MSGPILRGAAGLAKVRPLSLGAASSGPARPPEPVVDPELVTLRLNVSALSLQVEQGDARLEQLERELKSVRLEALEQGRAEGQELADARMAERLAQLKAGVRQANALLAEEFARLESLALALAHEGLAKILGDPAAHKALLAATIRRQLGGLEAQAAFTVEVSPADFPDPASLSCLAAALARPDVELKAVEALGYGECRIRLRLGTLEVGVPHQWGRLQAALQALAEPDPAAEGATSPKATAAKPARARTRAAAAHAQGAGPIG